VSEARDSKEPSGRAGNLREQRSLWITVGLVVLAVSLPLVAFALRPRASVAFEITRPFTDDFDRDELGDGYWAGGGFWRLANHQLLSPGAKNNPLWLRAALPADVQVEFDARSESPEGDVKCEIFGNGYDHASGYILIFGGWNNTISVIARLNEHGVPVTPALPDPIPNGGEVRVERRDLRVEPGRTYHWTVRRQGGTLAWLLDGQPAMEIVDPHPLRGPGNDRFAFSTWDVDVFYDNLKITPL
jgi:hypothetical protein